MSACNALDEFQNYLPDPRPACWPGRRSCGCSTDIMPAGFPSGDIIIWLKADALVLNDNDPVASWPDESGNGNNFSSGGLFPIFRTNQINGLPAVRFIHGSSTGIAKTNPSWTPSKPSTASEGFFVVKVDADPPSGGPINIMSRFGSPSGDRWPDTDGHAKIGWCKTTQSDIGDLTPSLAQWRLFNVWSAANDFSVLVDGAVVFSSGTNTFALLDQPLVGGPAATSPLAGYIAEHIMCNRKLASDEREAVKAYIRGKYALSIA